MLSHRKGDHVMNMHGVIIWQLDMKMFYVLQAKAILHKEIIYLDVYYYSILGRYVNS